MAFYREHPVTFGLFITLVSVPMLIFAMIRYPSFGTLITENWAWGRFGVFTATIFPLAIAYFSPRHASGVFWIVMTALFVVHVIFFVAFIHYFRHLTGFDYTLSGPIEALVFVFVIPRATRMLHHWRLGRSSHAD